MVVPNLNSRPIGIHSVAWRACVRFIENDAPQRAGAIAFSAALADPEKFERLEWLFLNGSNIADKGAAALGKALLTGVKELNRLALQECKIGDEGAKAFADCINTGAGAQTVEFLYFQKNELMTEEGKNALAMACKGKIRCHLGWPPPLGGLAPEEWDR